MTWPLLATAILTDVSTNPMPASRRAGESIWYVAVGIGSAGVHPSQPDLGSGRKAMSSVFPSWAALLSRAEFAAAPPELLGVRHDRRSWPHHCDFLLIRSNAAMNASSTGQGMSPGVAYGTWAAAGVGQMRAHAPGL